MRRGITSEELPSWAAGVFGTLATHLQRINVPTVGDPFVLYLKRGEHLEVEAGLPVIEPITTKGEVRSSSLPGGPAIATWHSGPAEDLDGAFEAIDAWLERQAAEATGPAFVVHHPDPDNGPDTPGAMSEVIQPYRD